MGGEWKGLKPTVAIGGGDKEKAVLELAAELDPNNVGATAPGGFPDLGQRLLRGA